MRLVRYKQYNTPIFSSLSNHYGMDVKFLQLAIKGKPLVQKLYMQTAFFKKYHGLKEMSAFPESGKEKCRLLKAQKVKE